MKRVQIKMNVTDEARELLRRASETTTYDMSTILDALIRTHLSDGFRPATLAAAADAAHTGLGVVVTDGAGNARRVAPEEFKETGKQEQETKTDDFTLDV